MPRGNLGHRRKGEQGERRTGNEKTCLVNVQVKRSPFLKGGGTRGVEEVKIQETFSSRQRSVKRILSTKK